MEFNNDSKLQLVCLSHRTQNKHNIIKPLFCVDRLKRFSLLNFKLLIYYCYQSQDYLLVLTYNLNQCSVVVQFKMDFNIDQKIKAATQPLIKRIASLQEELRIIKLLLEQPNGISKTQITQKQNQHERLTAQKAKNVTEKRNNKAQEETSKPQTVNKHTKGTKAALQNKDAKSEQNKKMKPESKKGNKKQTKDAGKKAPSNQIHENQSKNEIVSEAHSQITSTICEMKSVIQDENLPVTVGQSINQMVLQNDSFIDNVVNMDELSLAQNKTFSVEEQNLMDKVNQEIQMMRRQETQTAQTQDNVFPTAQQNNSTSVLQTVLISVQTQKPQTINEAVLIKYQQQIKAFVTTEGSVADTQQIAIHLEQQAAAKPKNTIQNETSQTMLSKLEILVPKTGKKPNDKSSFNQTRKETPKNIKQIDNKGDKPKNIFQAKPKTETKIVNASINKSTMKQSIHKQKAAVKSVVNSAKKTEIKQAKLKSEQKNDDNVHSISQTTLNEQVSQTSQKQQDKASPQLQTIQTVNL